jgi:hypothetical protein
MAALRNKVEAVKEAEAKEMSGDSLKTPRAAAIAGIIFVVLIAVATVMIRLALPGDPSEAGDWLDNGGMRSQVVFALNLVPFAGIAFLWLIGVVRSRLGEREDRFFATVFLGSGLLYVAMLFAAAAIGAGLLASFDSAADAASNSATWQMGRNAAFSLVTVYSTKMAAVFTISLSTIFLKTRVTPRLIPFIGFAIALVLLFLSSLLEWASLLFPAWVLLLSVYLLVVSFRKQPGRPEQLELPEAET